MKVLVTLILVFALAQPVFAQKDSIYAFYDKHWLKINDPRDASFFRVVKDLDEGKYLVRDYNISGNLYFVGTCTELEPRLKITGPATLYHETGAVQQVGEFNDQKARGLHRYWYEDGSPHKVVFHPETGLPIFHQFWSREGEEKLVNGTGLAIETSPGLPDRHFELKDSAVVGSFTRDESGQNIYAVLDQQPEYPGGYDALINDLKAALQYPKIARRHGIEGTVYVSFIITASGTLQNPPVVIRGINAACDAEAVRAVTTLDKWVPGRHKGEPVAVRYVIPIKFSLKG